MTLIVKMVYSYLLSLCKMSHFFFYPSLQYSLKPSYIPFPPQGSLCFLKIIAQ